MGGLGLILGRKHILNDAEWGGKLITGGSVIYTARKAGWAILVSHQPISPLSEKRRMCSSYIRPLLSLVADIYSPNFDLLLWKSITTKEFDRSESRWVAELS